MNHEGRCHCGALGFQYSTARPVSQWSVRACGCTFCRAHGGRYTSDPEGQVRFSFDGPEKLVRYEFGTRTAEFLICGACGVCLGAVTGPPGQQRAVLNVNTMNVPALPEAAAISFDGESVEQRQERHQRNWTPVAGS